MPLNPKVEISGSDIHGYCWRAKEDIANGEMIWKAGEVDEDAKWQHNLDDIKKWPKEQQETFFNYHIGGDVYSAPYTADGKVAEQSVLQEYYINHSCDGNSWYIGDDLLVANKDIKKGDEIYYDYAMTETDPEWSLNCLCKKAACRGVVRGDDYKKKELQERYGDHFMVHVLKAIEEDKKTRK